MGKLEKYSSYKDSGIEWLGEIPYNWEIKELKYALKFTTGGTPSSGVENYYNGEEPWVTIADMTGRYIEKSHFISKKAVRECNMQIVPKNSLLYSFKLSVGQVAFTKEEIYTNEAIASFYPSKNIDLNFWYYVLPIFLIKNANTNIYGAFLLNQDLIKNALIIFPPKQEQTKIASFLDEKTAQIDEVISQKEKLIELLKERKQIVINDAVTKGLDKDIEFVNSGVEWIGEIPKHWDISKLGTSLKPISIKNRADLPLLSVTREQGVILRDVDDKESNHNFIPDDLSGYKMVEKGQFAMNKMKAWQGSYGISDYTGIVSPAYFIFELNGIEPTFFHKAIRSSVYVPFFIKASDGVRIGQWDLSKSRMKEIPFYIPPKDEQLQIVEYIENQTSKIDKAIELQQNYIAKLKEYKASLIDSVVTGKVRVA
ncbi:restriction endonuclease subunit S [Aliarcobacter butzleri]|uniref:restriction endonuclease subunit S n=1 Tax=Aliarcobacter butzleri TaxID=28197 RepID=UPI0024DE3EA6|nr:restriction endonuclease subunit S [Aliarcobacter butzleri]MDK2069856.1 restriction endonuclease subunit S [Aliarcobacter butzleri]